MGADVFIDKRNPADDCLDAISLIGKGEQEVGFLDDLAGLDYYSSRNSCLGGYRLKLWRELVLGKRRACGDPRIVLFRVAPEMVVGVDHVRFCGLHPPLLRLIEWEVSPATNPCVIHHQAQLRNLQSSRECVAIQITWHYAYILP